jgi:hypothetical protein
LNERYFSFIDLKDLDLTFQNCIQRKSNQIREKITNPYMQKTAFCVSLKWLIVREIYFPLLSFGLFVCLFVLRRVLSCSPVWLWIHDFLPSECCDYRHVPPHLPICFGLTEKWHWIVGNPPQEKRRVFSISPDICGHFKAQPIKNTVSLPLTHSLYHQPQLKIQ